MKTQTFMGQKILFMTELFGKPYFWMEDGDGTVYLAKAKPKNNANIEGHTGKVTYFNQEWIPDFL